MSLRSFLASFANTLCVGTLGPLVLEDRPEVDGQAAWEAFQAEAAERKQKAKDKHQRVKGIEEAQQEVVHSALAYGSRSIPSRDVVA